MYCLNEVQSWSIVKETVPSFSYSDQAVMIDIIRQCTVPFPCQTFAAFFKILDCPCKTFDCSFTSFDLIKLCSLQKAVLPRWELS